MSNMSDCWLYCRCNHKDCDKFCLRRYKLDSLFSLSLLSETQRKKIALKIDEDGTDLNEFRQLAEIEHNIEAFVTEGKNLFIHSPICGCGKSSWAIRMIQSYFDEIWPETELECRAMFVSVPRFLNAIKENISNKNEYAQFIKNNIFKADLIVWDDISAKCGTEYEIDQLLSILDSRIALGKANIYTSNRNIQEIEEDLGQRIASRMRNAIDIELHGKDKRHLAVEAKVNG